MHMTSRRYTFSLLFFALCVLSHVYCQTDFLGLEEFDLTELEFTEFTEFNEEAHLNEETELPEEYELIDLTDDTEFDLTENTEIPPIKPIDPTDEAYPTDIIDPDAPHIEALPQPVIDVMASREMRHHHLLWHNIRNTWTKLDAATQQAITDLGWACPRPSQNTTETGSTVNLQDNGSGEDFLYMHRQMIQNFESIIANMSEPYSFSKWVTIPMPNDTMYPVPAPYNGTNAELTSSVASWKTDDVYFRVITSKEVKFKSKKYLRNVTLGQLGSQIEYELHNGLHMRWSQNTSIGIRNRPANPVPNIDPKWDVPAYDWLIDSYSSQNNPYFYKIHYWIDERIQDWMDANNVTDLIWNNTWVGGPMTMVTNLVDVGKTHNLRGAGNEIPAPGSTATVMKTMSHDMGSMDMSGMDDDSGSQGGVTVNVMEKLVEILSKAGVQYNIYDDISTCEEEGIDWLAPEFST